VSSAEQPISNRLSSLRWKLAALVASVAVIVSGLDLWLIPNRTAAAEEQELSERAFILASMLAEPIGVAMDLEQPPSSFGDTLNTSLVDPLVMWVAAYDVNGNKIASVSEGAAQSLEALERSAPKGAIVAVAKIQPKSRKQKLGSIAVAMKSQRIAERGGAARKTMAMQAIVVVGVGLVVALFLSGRMAAAMQRITEAAQRITRGDVSQHLELPPRTDELGEMARAFRDMNARLRELQDTVVRVAKGDLTCRIDSEGELFVAFRTMVDNLRELTGRIGESANSVAAAAAGMFSSVREQESSAIQQNTALEEVRRTIEALAGSAEQVARDAAGVREMAERSLVSTQHTAEQTRLVSRHSDRIGEILSLIQDIADKSDILALNAALEGTKAGEVGRGFSLVAAEMRRLSEHVVDSVRDIRKLVADMHEASHASVLATEEGIKLARETAASAAKISEAAVQQREGTTQVKTAVVEIVGVVNESLRGSTKTTRSAESLLQLSHKLKAAARNFRVGDRDREPLEVSSENGAADEAAG
jgi:methyl-accepting chemotaxis protein